MMSLWDALRMNMMISYQELVRTFPKLMMLDEPVAGMSVAERQKTAQLLRKIAGGRSVLVIEHDMQFVEDIADHVTVMHQGKVLSEGSINKVKNDPRVIDVYLGH